MSGAPSILLVDDHPENLLALEAVIEPLGVGCVRATSGFEALREVLRHDFAAIVLDVHMPDMDGLETAALIKRRTRSRDIPIVFVTGRDRDPATIARAFSVGGVDYVMKPYEPELLRSKLGALVELHRKEDELRESEERFRAAFEDAPIGIAMLDTRGRWVDANRALADMLGRTTEDLLESPAFDLRHLSGPDGEDELAQLLAGTTHSFCVERRLFGATCGTVWAAIHVSLARDRNGDPLHLICQVEDATERKATEESMSAHIAFLAYHDELTRLPNRAMLREHLDLALARALRHDNAVALLNLDLNRFKLVNDSLGHAAGDELLRQAGTRLAAAVRASDLVARVGGDEFVVLLADLDASKGREISELVAAGIHESLSAPFTISGAEFYIGTSVGISLFPGVAAGGSPDAEGLIRSADAAMYEAKQNGARTMVFEETGEEPRERLGRMTRLRRAADEGEFVLHWLPIVDLDTTRLCGVEALIRWHDDERGWIPPLELMKLAEESGLIERIGMWVLGEAARQQREWADAGLELEVAVNISARQLWAPNAAESMLATIHEAGADPSRMLFELAESGTTRASDAADHALRALRDAGVRIALDDFAHSPFSTLQRMEVDIVKIDGPVLAAAAEGTEGEMMLRAIIQLAHGLGIWPLAEGVETQRHYEILRRAGCRFGQGFFFGEPMPADEVPSLAEPVQVAS